MLEQKLLNELRSPKAGALIGYLKPPRPHHSSRKSNILTNPISPTGAIGNQGFFLPSHNNSH